MNKKGFTLLELLVVIAIIGLLSTMVVVSLNSARAKGRDATRIAHMKAIQTAMEFIYDDNGTYALATPCHSAQATWPQMASACLDLETYIPTRAQLNDPNSDGFACPATPSGTPIDDKNCNYGFSVAPNATDYKVTFYLEAASQIGNTDEQLCMLTEDGLACPAS